MLPAWKPSEVGAARSCHTPCLGGSCRVRDGGSLWVTLPKEVAYACMDGDSLVYELDTGT